LLKKNLRYFKKNLFPDNFSLPPLSYSFVFFSFPIPSILLASFLAPHSTVKTGKQQYLAHRSLAPHLIIFSDKCELDRHIFPPPFQPTVATRMSDCFIYFLLPPPQSLFEIWGITRGRAGNDETAKIHHS
jgi:hypothetical protein